MKKPPLNHKQIFALYGIATRQTRQVFDRSLIRFMGPGARRHFVGSTEISAQVRSLRNRELIAFRKGAILMTRDGLDALERFI